MKEGKQKAIRGNIWEKEEALGKDGERQGH